MGQENKIKATAKFTQTVPLLCLWKWPSTSDALGAERCTLFIHEWQANGNQFDSADFNFLLNQVHP